MIPLSPTPVRNTASTIHQPKIYPRWALAWGWFFLALVLGVSYLGILHQAGRFTYGLDDAYIHMAMAKNIVLHGVYGVTPYAFSSASSSLIWQGILTAGFKLAGIHELVPLAFNIVLAFVTVILVWRLAPASLRNRPFRLGLFLTAIIFLGALPKAVFDGMEHMLQILLLLVYPYLAAQTLAAEKSHSWRAADWALLILTPLMVMTRYENLFVIGLVALLLACQRRWRQGVGIILLSLLPVIGFGLFFTQHGDHFLPNSILLKGQFPDGGSIKSWLRYFSGYNAYKMVAYSAFYLIPLAMAALVVLADAFKKSGRFWDKQVIGILLFIGATLLQAFFGSVVAHYSLGLVFWGLFLTLPSFFNWWDGWWAKWRAPHPHPIWLAQLALLGMVLLPALPVVERAAFFLVKIPVAAQNIYDQQYQMGLFCQKYYQGTSVAASDIGAVAFLGDYRLLDFFGLGNVEVLNYRKRKTFDQTAIQALTRELDTRIAIVYEENFGPKQGPENRHATIPPEWVKAGRWRLLENYACGRDTVTFYAVQPGEAERLRENLHDFRRVISASVMVDIDHP